MTSSIFHLINDKKKSDMKICLKLIIANIKKKLAELGSKVHKFVTTAEPDFLA